jgi:hypothetical protein
MQVRDTNAVTTDSPGWRRTDRLWIAAIAVGVVAAWAAVGVAVALPEARWGAAALITRPTLAAAVAAGLLLAVAARWRGYGALAPLILAALPLALARVGGAWIFAGAGVVILWALAAGATLNARLPRAIPAPRPLRQALAAGVAAAVWLGAVAIAVAPFSLTGDAPHYLTIARSLVADGDLDLRDDYDHRDYADFYPGSLEPRHTNTSPWGEQYPFHGLGVAVLVAPAFAWWGVAGATATVVAVMAGASALVWLAAWHLLGDALAAWFGWAALVLSAPYGLHAAAIYPDGPAAAGVAAALWLIVRLTHGTAPPLWMLAAASLGLAALPWLHARLALPAGVFGVAAMVAIWRGQPDRVTRLAWLLMLPAISCAGWIASAQVMFGTWNPSAAILQRTAPGGLSDMGRGLLGLVADHQYGLVPAAPVMAAAAWAAVGFTRAFPLLGVASVAATLGVLVVSSFWVWWGGDSAPARFLTVTLPALALWLAHLWSRTGPGGRRVLVLALGATSAMTLLYAGVDGGARAYAFADGRGSVFDAFSDSVDFGLALPSLFRPGATPNLALAQAVSWLAGALIATWLVVRLPPTRGEAAASGAGALFVAMAMMVGATAGWRAAGVSPWTPGAAALAFVQAASARGIVGGGAETGQGLHLRTPESVPVSPPVALYVPNLPAGSYAVRVDAPRSAGSSLQLELGRGAWPFVSWTVGEPPPSFTLPMSIHSVRVVGPLPSDTTVWLEPRQLDRPSVAGQARRATRYGELVVFSMDDDTHPETTGLWTGGNRATRLVIATASAPAPVAIDVEAGPSAADVTLSASGRSERLTLAPRASQQVTVDWPTDRSPIDLEVTVRGAFPAAALGDATDSRTLGVWLAFSAGVARR